MKKNKSHKQSKSMNRGAGNARGTLPVANAAVTTLTVAASVSPIHTFDLPFTPIQIAVASGSLASSVPLTSTSVPNFSTRFQNLFQEYRLIGIRMVIKQITTPINTSAGVSAFFVDEKNNSTPTASQALDRPRVEIPNILDTSARKYGINWTAHDLTDLDWSQISATPTPLYLKSYSDTANFMSTATTNTTFALSGTMRFQFRGLL